MVHRRIPGPLLLESWRSLGWPSLETIVGASSFGPPTVVFSPSTFVPPLRAGAGAATIHDLTFLEQTMAQGEAEGLKQWIARRTGPSYLRWAWHHRIPELDLLLCVSEASARAVRDNLARLPGSPKPRVAVTPLGVDPIFRPQQAEVETSIPYYFHIGGPHPRKDLPTLLSAFGQYLERRVGDPNAEPVLVLAGFADSSGEVAGKIPICLPDWIRTMGPRRLPSHLACVSPRAADRTVTIGYADRQLLVRLYSGARALLFPSIEEGFGLPVLEAMACGCPVITTTTTAVVEHLPAGAVITVAPRQADELARTLLQLDEDPEKLRSLSESGPKAASRFSWQATAEATLEALLSVSRAVSQ
jgi:glycosyltransferase involved in cell wall biosynthesis